MLKTSNRNLVALWFILPALIATVVVHFLPNIFGIYISLIDLDIRNFSKFLAAPFVGLKNYIDLFTTNKQLGLLFFRSFYNILVYGIFTIPIGYVVSLAVALLLNQNFPGQTILRGLILLPYITPDSVAYGVWRFMFQSEIGIINTILMNIGMIKVPIVWLVGEHTLWPVIIASIWKSFPFGTLILLAGLQSIPKELYESANVDGASKVRQFLNITLPMLKPVSLTLLLLNVIWNFQAFNQFYVFLGANPGPNADVPSTVINREAFTNLHYGMGSALSTLLLLLTMVLVLIYLRAQKKATEGDL